MDDINRHASLSGSTHSSLLLRIQANDQEAWRIVVRLYDPLIHYWCKQSGLARDDWADIVQTFSVPSPKTL